MLVQVLARRAALYRRAALKLGKVPSCLYIFGRLGSRARRPPLGGSPASQAAHCTGTRSRRVNAARVTESAQSRLCCHSRHLKKIRRSLVPEWSPSHGHRLRHGELELPGSHASPGPASLSEALKPDLPRLAVGEPPSPTTVPGIIRLRCQPASEPGNAMIIIRVSDSDPGSP